MSSVVQLRIKKRINPGDELFVKYGAEFFELNSCLCRTCSINLAEVRKNEIAFDILPEEALVDLADEELEDMRAQLGAEEVVACRPKKRRVKGRELIEMFNNLSESPPDANLSPRKAAPAESCPLEFELQEPISGTNHDESENSQLILSNYGTIQQNFESESEESKEVVQSQVVIRASSPMRSNATLACSLSAIDADVSDCESTLDDAWESVTRELFVGSETSVHEASTITSLFCSKFNLSDECSSTLHSLIRVLLPETNNFPSGFSYVQNVKRQFENEIRILRKTSENSLCVLSFRFQVRDIVERNINQIRDYSNFRRNNPLLDFNASLCPIFEINRSQPILINLILFSDGVNIKKSTFKKELWPIWIQIADLPPKFRMARKNVVLCALFVDATHPDWKEVVDHLHAELSTSVKVKVWDNFSVNATYKVRLLISDLGAKSHILNMLKFNGFYGCHFCTAKGKTIGRTHAYYPYNDQGSLREPFLNDVYVEIAETLSVRGKTNVVGVNGKSAFSNIIEGLPMTAPIDYMHCILQGVFPDVLRQCFKFLSPQQKIILNKTTKELVCPREMVSYSRKIRSLEEINQFKANEFFNWLLYVSVILFLDRLPVDVYSHLSNLVFGIRLLLESATEENVSKAEKLLDKFSKDIVRVHKNERIETINVHCVKHLAEQVRRYGPLFCQSAMSFESANRTLGEVYTGSHTECEIICRRVLQRHKLLDVNLENQKIDSLYRKISARLQTNDQNYSEEFIETAVVQEARKMYNSAKFFNRIVFKSQYFDSPAYKRSTLGNCYVYYMDNDQEVFGKIQYFVQIPGSSFLNKTLAKVLRFTVIENIGPVHGFLL